MTERLYVTHDQFQPTALLDREGEVVERYGYSPFGVRRVMAPDFSERASSEYDWDCGFQGQFLDGESGYSNYGYRYYVAFLGRWASRDPMVERLWRLLRTIPGSYESKLLFEIGSRLSNELTDTLMLELIHFNLYRFAGNSPLNLLDLVGLLEFPWCGNWGGPGLVNGQFGRWTETDCDWPEEGEPGFVPPLSDFMDRGEDRCYYHHDRDLRRCSCIIIANTSQACRRQADLDLAECLRIKAQYVARVHTVRGLFLSTPNDNSGQALPGCWRCDPGAPRPV